MSIRVQDFSSLTDDLQELTEEHMAGKVAEMEAANLLFDIRDTDRRTYDLTVLHGVSGIQRVSDGQDLPRVSSDEGDSITYTQSYYGAIVPITKAMRKFDLYDRIEDQATSIIDDAFDKVDQSMADVLTYGTSTSYTDVYGATQTAVCPDGLSLFSTAHTNGTTSSTFSNVINDGTNNNPALSRDALVNERVRAWTYTDVNGLTRPVRLDCVIVPPSLEDQAERLLFSTLIPGEANNDTNALRGKYKQLKVWERLETRSDGTDTSAYWFLADSTKVKKGLKALFAERPALDAPEQVFANKDWEYSIDFYYVLGRGWPTWLRGSTGVN